MKIIIAMTVLVGLSACGVMTVSTDELRPGAFGGITLETKANKVTYEQVWRAAISAMGSGMTIVESHKPSGTIKSRVGSAPSGKVVAIFITPTDAHAPQYKVQVISKTPRGFNSPSDGRMWEPSVVRDFEAALSQKQANP